MLSLISHFLVNNMKEGTVSDFRKKKKKCCQKDMTNSVEMPNQISSDPCWQREFLFQGF